MFGAASLFKALPTSRPDHALLPVAKKTLHRRTAPSLDGHDVLRARKSLSETEDQILRRLLGIGGDGSIASTAVSTDGAAWERRGLVLPNGTKWRIVYGNNEYSGTIVDGRFRFRARSFKSPSGLTIALCRTATGARTSLNGWRYVEIFQARRDRWFKLQDLLDEA